jgi:hypothetical protein
MSNPLPIKSTKSSFFVGFDYGHDEPCEEDSVRLLNYSTSVISDYQRSQTFPPPEDQRFLRGATDGTDETSNARKTDSNAIEKSSQECFARFSSSTSNKEPWLDEEKSALLKLVTKLGPYNWSYIAEQLGTNRSATDCLRIYRKSMQDATLHSDWSKEEDSILNEAVRKYGTDSWQAIACELSGRTSVQCMNRYRKSIECQLESTGGRWTEDEERQLFIAAAIYNVPTLATSTAASILEQPGKILDPPWRLIFHDNSLGLVSRPKWVDVAKLVPGK